MLRRVCVAPIGSRGPGWTGVVFVRLARHDSHGIVGIPMGSHCKRRRCYVAVVVVVSVLVHVGVSCLLAFAVSACVHLVLLVKIYCLPAPKYSALVLWVGNYYGVRTRN